MKMKKAMRTHKMPGVPFGGKFGSVTNVGNKFNFKSYCCFCVCEIYVVKCLHGNVPFATAKQL